MPPDSSLRPEELPNEIHWISKNPAPDKSAKGIARTDFIKVIIWNDTKGKTLGKGSISLIGGGTPPDFQGTFVVKSSPTPKKADDLTKEDKLELLEKMVKEVDILQEYIREKQKAKQESEVKSLLPRIRALDSPFAVPLLPTEMRIVVPSSPAVIGSAVTYSVEMRNFPIGNERPSHCIWSVDGRVTSDECLLEIVFPEGGTYDLHVVAETKEGAVAEASRRIIVEPMEPRQQKQGLQ